MRIVLINYAYDPGIIAPDALLDRYATLTGWSEALVAAGALSVVVGQRFWRDAELESAGVRYAFRLDEGPPVADERTRPAALHEVVVAARPDVVHVNGLMFPAQLESLRRSLPRSCALIVQDHAGVAPASRRWWDVRARARHASMRRGLRAADALFFTSADQARLWREAGVIAPQPRVYPIVESSTTMRAVAREAAREASGVDGRPASLWAGRLTANKDPLTVLDGFERALAELPEARLSMVYGEDDLLPEVRSRVERSAALRARVRLCGRVSHDRLAAYYSAADLFVLGSHHEGSGYALIEALACGSVPVVTDIPSFRAIADDGRLGALWPPGDAWAFARALTRAASGDVAAKRLEIAADFERRLSWPAVGRRALALYQEVAAARIAGPHA